MSLGDSWRVWGQTSEGIVNCAKKAQKRASAGNGGSKACPEVYLAYQGRVSWSTTKGAHLATLDPPLKTRLAGS